MIKALTVEEGIKNYLTKNNIVTDNWTIKKQKTEDYYDTLIMHDGKKVPLLRWRYNEKNHTLYEATRKGIGKLCSTKSYVFVPSNYSLEKVLFKEIDLAQWWLNSKVKYVVGMESSSLTGNYLLKMENNTVANIEIACTMPVDAEIQEKHIIFGTEGSASDIVVDTMVVKNNIYLYNNGAQPKTFSDVEPWMYGLNTNEIDTAYCAAMLIVGKENVQSYIKSSSVVKKLVKLSRHSAIENKRIWRGKSEPN